MDATGPGELSIFLILCGILGMLFLAIGVVVFVLLNQKKTLVHRQKLQDLKLRHREELLHSAIQSQERERTRVARDLHDGVGSILSATKLFIHQLNQSSAEKHFKAIHEETRNALDEAIENVRTISRDLLPSSFEDNGLDDSLRDLCERIIRSHPIRVLLLIDRSTELEISVELAIYRITQELLNNTIKYANATEATLQFKEENRVLIYTYEDNGKGVDLNQSHDNGLGLGSIESRALLIGAHAEMTSSPGNGFRYNFTIPISD